MKKIIRSTVGFSTPVDLEMDPHDAVGDVKNRVCASQGITDANSVSLALNGKPLDDRRKIKELGLKEEDVLELVPYHRTIGSSLLPSFYEDFQPRRELSTLLQARLAQEAKMIMVKLLPITMDLDNPLKWTARLEGTGKYKGNTYIVKIELDESYPRRPPLSVRFLTPIRHPNVFMSTGGTVCLSTLEPGYWRPTYNLCTVYYSLQYLLEHPNHEIFERTAHTIRRLARSWRQ